MRYGDRSWRLLVARVSGSAAGCAGGFRRPRPTRAEAIAEVRTVTELPDVLADAAAQCAARSRDWYRGHEVQLLLDAGADPDLVAEFFDRWVPRAGEFNLAAFADRFGNGR